MMHPFLSGLIIGVIFTTLCFGIAELVKDIRANRTPKPITPCIHGYEDWDECPDCGH